MIYAGIFLASLSAITYEIALTRVFSISLSYHFAFMVISIAMLGLALSGTVLSLLGLRAPAAGTACHEKGLRAPAILGRLKSERALGWYLLMLSASMTLCYGLSNLIPFDPGRLTWQGMELLYIPLYYLLLSIPFFFFGLAVSTAYALRSGQAGLVYGADMVGAGAGSLCVLGLMAWAGPEGAVPAASAMSAGGAFLLGKRKTGGAVFLAAVSILILNPAFLSPRMSPYKGLSLALAYPGARHIKTYHSGFSRVDVFESPMARFAPGLSLKFRDGLPPQLGLSVDGSELNAVTKASGGMEFLDYLPSALPYKLRHNPDVLVVEPKGGLPVLLARRNNARTLMSVDSNPLIIDILRGDLSEFSGGIYAKNTYKVLARSTAIVQGPVGPFDIIDISLMGATPAGLFGIAEDYRFTVEAMKEYIARLKPDGLLSLSMFIIPPPRTEFRLLATAIDALDELGIKDTGRHIAAIRSWGTVTLLIRRSPFTKEEITEIKEFSSALGFDLVYYPGVREEETNIHVTMPGNEYFHAFRRLIDPEEREGFLKGYIFDIAPVRDESPFFHHYLRWDRLVDVYRLVGRKWQFFLEVGYLLPVIFLQAVVLSLIIIILPVIRGAAIGGSGTAATATYFGALGLGYMFVEVALIQKAILPLEQPAYAVALVLAAMLISSGAGGFLSERFSVLRTSYPIALLSVLAGLSGFFLTGLMEAASAYPFAVKAVFLTALIFPLGFLMGIPFALGMRTLGSKSPALIPWAWAVNGCFSVLGPVLAAMLAMALGFKWVLWLGAGAYATAFIVMRRWVLPVRNTLRRRP